MTGDTQLQPMCAEPSPEELQAWADEAQAFLDSGEVIVSDNRKAHATITALRSHAALKARIEFLEARVAILDGCCDHVDCLVRGEAMQQQVDCLSRDGSEP